MKSKDPNKPAISCVRGVSLIELMIGIAIGMLVVVGALSMYLSTNRTYRTAESVSRVQENARIAVELMASDIREAGFTPCGSNVEVASSLNPPFNNVTSAVNGMTGFDDNVPAPGVAIGNARPLRAANTDAIVVGASRGTGLTVQTHNEPSAVFTVNMTNHGIQDGEIVMVCDNELATIFQATNTNQSNSTIGHNQGNSNPGNARKCLGNDANCGLSQQQWKSYARNGIITRYEASVWYIGCSGTVACNQPGGRSLFRIANQIRGTAAEEMVTDVDNMQIVYLRRGETTYVPASAILPAQWNDVTAARITLTLTSPEANVTTNQAVNQGRLTRTVTHTVTLRNRVP